MLLSSLHEYGLRCAVQLAKLPSDQTASASQIAEKENLSVEYVSKIMLLLRKGSLVESIRGKHGGFRFIQKSSQILVRDIFLSLKSGGDDIADFCSSHGGRGVKSDLKSCGHSSSCAIRPLWEHLFNSYQELIGSISLQDLCEGAENVKAKISNLRCQNGAKQTDNVTRSAY